MRRWFNCTISPKSSSEMPIARVAVPTLNPVLAVAKLCLCLMDMDGFSPSRFTRLDYVAADLWSAGSLRSLPRTRGPGLHELRQQLFRQRITWPLLVPLRVGN